jgi:hypothetical protein
MAVSQPDPASLEVSPRSWRQVLATALLSLVCFEIGACLLFFPWLDLWRQNYFATLSPGWSELWGNAYFRGAVSGLGLVNIAISLVELFRLNRFWWRRP